MIRLASLLLLLASPGFAFATEHEDDAFVFVVYRSAGFTNPEHAKPFDHYKFTVDEEGRWEFEPMKGEAAKGKFDADEWNRWFDEMKDAGLYRVGSDPMLGARDEPFMEITVNVRGTRRVRIALTEKLAQAIESRIVEIVTTTDAPG